MGAIDILNESPTHRDNQERNQSRSFRGEQEVDMVGHQDIGMELAALTLQGVAQPAKVGETILAIEESVVPASVRDQLTAG